jgi:hypothetical protein
MWNVYDINFDALDAYFDKSHLFSDVQANKFGNPKCYDWKDPKKKPKQNAMKYRKIRRMIELCMREMIFRFEMNF